jgi:4-diphosphocytidyl-2-C-methyl-D-erythritol kinase
VIFPEVHVNTAWAYKTFAARSMYANAENDLVEIVKQPVDTWKNKLINDFERIVFEAHPALKKIKMHLYEQGALYASLSGSGSSVFGIFEEKPDGNVLANLLNVRLENIWIEKGSRFGE